jgi:hypothetical protein
MTRYYWCDDKTKEKIEEEDIHDDGGVTPIILMVATEVLHKCQIL